MFAPIQRLHGQKAGRLRVFYYGVHDTAYPRNSRIRSYLETRSRISVDVAPRARIGGRFARAKADLFALLRGARRADVIVLSEFRLTHAPLVRLVAWITGARVVIDGFVGLYETAVGDWASVSPRSFRARILALQDHLAASCADLFLIDTEVRAEAIRAALRPGAPVLALPVGAPDWALYRAPAERGPLRLLYYGNYIPLHGLDIVLDALDLLSAQRDFHVVFVGDGPLRPGIESRVKRSAWSAAADFRAPVPEQRLAELIAESDVVLGIFGSSAKASGVIANKVWQGLACGRTVVTQKSPALADLPESVRPLLVSTAPGSPRALAEALVSVEAPDAEAARVAGRRLEVSVTERFEALGRWIDGHPATHDEAA